MNTPNCLSTVSTYPLGGGLAGLVTTGSVKGMLIGAVSGAAFAGIGNAFAAGGRFAGAGSRFVNAAGKLSNAGRALKIGLHGLAGGTRSVLSGGNFKAGFLASGFAQTAAPAINHIDSDVGQVVAAGVAGGVGSEIAGGSFEDGFVTGVFSRALNDSLHPDDGLRGNGPPIEDRPPGSASLTDLRYATPFDLLKFGNWGPYKGPWNIRDKYFADYPANDHSYLRNELTDQGNWDYGYAVAAAGFNVDIATIIGGAGQLAFKPGASSLSASTHFDNSRDYQMIHNGYDYYQSQDHESQGGW